MGRAIEMENKLDALEARIKLVEDALEEFLQTRVHHVDLLDDVARPKVKGTVLEPDEEYTAPIGKRKKTKKTKTAPVG